MSAARVLYLVTEFEYIKGGNDKSAVKMMTWDFATARKEAERQFNSWPGKDNIILLDKDKEYDACFNYGHGMGTMTIGITAVEREWDLERECNVNNLRKFFKENGILTEKGVPKDRLVTCMMKLIEQAPGYKEAIRDILSAPLPVKKTRKRKLQLLSELAAMVGAN